MLLSFRAWIRIFRVQPLLRRSSFPDNIICPDDRVPAKRALVAPSFSQRMIVVGKHAVKHVSIVAGKLFNRATVKVLTLTRRDSRSPAQVVAPLCRIFSECIERQPPAPTGDGSLKGKQRKNLLKKTHFRNSKRYFDYVV